MAIAVTPREVAPAIKASRQEFRDVFLSAQVDARVVPRVAFEAVVTSADDTQAFGQALDRAFRDGWFETLLKAIMRADLHSASLTQLVAKASPENAELQAITTGDNGFPHPDLTVKGVENGKRWTVRVLVDDLASGTGVLIGPNLVLTAWHVVKELFDSAVNRIEAKQKAAKRLQVEFDDWLVYTGNGFGSGRPIRVRAHEQWCVVFSPCHDDELHARLPTPLVQLDGLWDYAVIRLGTTPGTERRWVRIDDRAIVPREHSEITLFHHPGAQQPLRSRSSHIVAPDASASAVVPRVRFLHGADAVHGSSGGPCFDVTFTLFGIHQGQWPANTEGAVNRGIPIERVRDHIKAAIGRLPAPAPEDTPLFRLSPSPTLPVEEPVIGRDSFVSTVWAAALGLPLILVVTGESRSGKSRCLDILSELLPHPGHQKVMLLAPSELSNDAEKLATSICNQAGATRPTFTTAKDFASTRAVWLSDEVLHKMVQALDVARKGRLVWLLFRDMDKGGLFGLDTSDFLRALCERAVSLGWLRIVFDGSPGDLPFAVHELVGRTRVAWPTLPEIETYLRRALTAHRRQVDDATVRAIAAHAYEELGDFIERKQPEALQLLARFLSRSIKHVLSNFPKLEGLQ